MDPDELSRRLPKTEPAATQATNAWPARCCLNYVKAAGNWQRQHEALFPQVVPPPTIHEWFVTEFQTYPAAGPPSPACPTVAAAAEPLSLRLRAGCTAAECQERARLPSLQEQASERGRAFGADPYIGREGESDRVCCVLAVG